MKKMNLTEDEQRQALQHFKFATTPAFDPRAAIQEFRAATTPKLIQILLVHLIAMARADGYLVKKELHAIQWLARELGYKSITFTHMLHIIYTQDQTILRLQPQRAEPVNMYAAQHNTHSNNTHGNSYDANPKNHSRTANDHSQQTATNPDEELQKAYEVLGVSAGMTEDEIRRAYKKLASQLHPDKLMTQELTPEQRQRALDKFKRVQAAYSFIKKNRSLYAAN